MNEDTGIGVEIEFTEAEFAAIGRLVWSYTVLEHELARAALWLRLQIATNNDNTEPQDFGPQLEKILKGALKSRFDSFLSALKSAAPGPEIETWASEAGEKFSHTLLWRDTVCHGSWRRIDAQMTVQFFDRESLRNGVEVPRTTVSIEELHQRAESALTLAIAVAKLSGTVKE